MIEVPRSYLLETTYKLALTSPYGRFRLGAIIARGRKIVSMGTNQRKTHPLQKKFTDKPHLAPWLHAEIHSISLCRVEDLEGADIYVARALANDNWATSRPCEGCQKALRHFGIKAAYFCMDDKFYYEEIA